MTNRNPDSRDVLVATLQAALDKAHARVRELEASHAVMAQRMADANERADRAEYAAATTRVGRR